jgi:hypothetical protein
MGVWPPLVGVVGVHSRPWCCESLQGLKERNVTTGYDNKIPGSEKYLSTYFSKWSQEINLEAAGHGRKLKSGAVAAHRSLIHQNGSQTLHYSPILLPKDE